MASHILALSSNPTFICWVSLTNSFHLKFPFFCPLERLSQDLPRASGQPVLGSYVTCGKRLLNTVCWCPFSFPCLLLFYSLSLPSFLVLLFTIFLVYSFILECGFHKFIFPNAVTLELGGISMSKC